MLRTIQVVLADDHALVRAGIRALLERIDKVEVVGEAGDGQQTLDLIEELDPDVVLLDLTMPGMSGFEVLKETSEKFPDVNMIVLSVHDSEEYAVHALRSGAVGYLPKSAASDELEVAIEQVLRGQKYLSPSIAPEASLEYSQEVSETTELTPRQLEVLALIAHGAATREIASALNIAVKTVETHRAQLMERLNIHDVAGLARYAIQKGLVNLDK